MILAINIILILVILIGIIIFRMTKKQREEIKITGKYPEGYWMGIGIATGIALGLPIGIALNNIALGTAVGIGIGVAIGAILEAKHKNNIRPLTDDEKETREKVIRFIGGLVLLGVIFLAVTDSTMIMQRW